jgi:hypothetical protein
MHLFQIVPENFFKPLASKYKSTYIDCLVLIYNTYKTELSFGVDREVIVSELENYFNQLPAADLVFDDDENEVFHDSRAKANAILRSLKDCGWIDFEVAQDFRTRVNLLDYAATMIESFNKIIRNEEMEYQSLVSQIHATLLNRDGYIKPYEYIIKRVHENTEELMAGFKKLNTSIRKHIETITSDKSAAEIVQNFFIYHKEIGSKAYHRIKTSDNISHFRVSILEKLRSILNEDDVFRRAVEGCMEIEQLPDLFEAEKVLRGMIFSMISAFRNLDDIIVEIDYKHSKYIGNAVARAKFLLTNTTNAEGKINRILAWLAAELNAETRVDLDDESNDEVMAIFNIFPQHFLDNESLHVVPISRKMALPEVLGESLGLSDEERLLRKLALQERNRSRFSHKTISSFVADQTKENCAILASAIPLESRRDLIRLIFVNLYGHDQRSGYRVIPQDQTVIVNNFRFRDFLIQRNG